MKKNAFLKDIGGRLKVLRGGRSQADIVKALNEILGEERTKEAYQHYESGRRLLRPDVLWGLSKIHHVSTDWILTGKEFAAKKQTAILPRLHKDTTQIANRIQTLSKGQKDALMIIIDAMGSKGIAEKR